METSICMIGWGVGNFNLLDNLLNQIKSSNKKIKLNILAIDNCFKDIFRIIKFVGIKFYFVIFQI